MDAMTIEGLVSADCGQERDQASWVSDEFFLIFSSLFT